MHIPALCDAEVLSALRGLVRRGALTRDVASAALAAYLDLPTVRHAETPVIRRALDLETFSAYDALYVALAEQLGASLLTTDARLARAVAAARGLGVDLV